MKGETGNLVASRGLVAITEVYISFGKTEHSYFCRISTITRNITAVSLWKIY
jgi:hypothetical protein